MFHPIKTQSMSGSNADLNSSSDMQHVIVSVDGNISSGKSTLLEGLKDHLNSMSYEVVSVPEPLEKWCNARGHNLLQNLYEDPKKNIFMFQHYVQLTRLSDFRDIKMSKVPYIEGLRGRVSLMERSLQNNKYIFCEVGHKTKRLDPIEYNVLNSWHEWIEQHYDLDFEILIYLRTSPSVSFSRMQNRGRKEELSVPVDYIKHLHEAYEDWLIRRKFKHSIAMPQIIVVDADKPKDVVLSDAKSKLQLALSILSSTAIHKHS